MKRFLLVSLMAALLVMAFTVSARTAEQGADLDDLTALAAYAPGDTAIFAAIRTDDGYFDTLDAVLNRVGGAFGMPPLSVTDEFSMSMPFGMSFEADVRPWLGDTAAFFIPSLESILLGGGDDAPFVVALSITDQAGADDYLQTMLQFDIERGWYERIELEDGNIFYEPDFRFDPSYLITEEVLLMGQLGRNFTNVVLPDSTRAPLSASESFSNTLNVLPSDDYNIVAYVNPSNVIRLVSSLLPLIITPDMGIPLEDIPDGETLVSAVGNLALGAVIIEDRALVLDIASTSDALGDLIADPIDLSLMDRVPASAPLVIQGQGLGGVLLIVLDALEGLDDLVDMVEPGLLEELGPATPSSLTTFFRLTFEGTYGLDLDETLAALNSDFLTFVTLGLDAETGDLALGANALLRSSDTDISDALVAIIGEIFTDILTSATFEDGVMDAPFGAIMSDPDAITFSAASDGDLVLFGSSADVAFMLDGDGDALTGSARYAFESSLFLPDTVTLFYIDTEPFGAFALAMIAALGDQMSEWDREDALALVALTDVLVSSSITAGASDGGFAIRATLTFAD